MLRGRALVRPWDRTRPHHGYPEGAINEVRQWRYSLSSHTYGGSRSANNKALHRGFKTTNTGTNEIYVLGAQLTTSRIKVTPFVINANWTRGMNLYTNHGPTTPDESVKSNPRLQGIAEYWKANTSWVIQKSTRILAPEYRVPAPEYRNPTLTSVKGKMFSLKTGYSLRST